MSVEQPRGALCRSCDAPITWVRTENGKRMPLDRMPTIDGLLVWSRTDDGRVRVITDERQRLTKVVHTMTKAEAEVCPTDETRYTSHFTTCPQRDQHRRRR